jgi:hypothetical protein
MVKNHGMSITSKSAFLVGFGSVGLKYADGLIPTLMAFLSNGPSRG